MNLELGANVWVLVPARGGSRGIPRKNLRVLGDKPLILHVLQEISKILNKNHLIVSTDSYEIAQISEPYACIHNRPPQFAQDTTTLDEVAVDVAQWLVNTGANRTDFLLTIQPTSPFLTHTSILEGVKLLAGGAKSLISVKDDRHLRWSIDENGKVVPLYSKRVNRQWLPPTLAETGGLIGSYIDELLVKGTRINEPIALLELNQREGLDIDTYADWAMAEYYARRKRIVIRVDATPKLGMGHVYRVIALAHELNEHDLWIVTRIGDEYQLGADFLLSHPYQVETITAEKQFFDLLDKFQPHLVILDVLDTNIEYISKIKGKVKRIVSFEDLGPGSRLADIVINDLYTDLYPQQNHWYGVQNAILGPQFETIQPCKRLNTAVKKILIAFGGTDPENLTVKALLALSQIGYTKDVTVVLGPGYTHKPINLTEFNLIGEVLCSVKNMALVMKQADMAITSAGRTVTELMSLGVPTLVLCQNIRELRHTHASSPYGVINLGLGQHVDISNLAQHISLLLTDVPLRQSMRTRALQAVRDRSNKTVVQRILNATIT